MMALPLFRVSKYPSLHVLANGHKPHTQWRSEGSRHPRRQKKKFLFTSKCHDLFFLFSFFCVCLQNRKPRTLLNSSSFHTYGSVKLTRREKLKTNLKAHFYNDISLILRPLALLLGTTVAPSTPSIRHYTYTHLHAHVIDLVYMPYCRLDTTMDQGPSPDTLHRLPYEA